ncbi:response regulator [Candidatus Kaiserbacteria bacterium]|nr:MAG: response regulator [Candidatus Kaiserbacteria bacterium]
MAQYKILVVDDDEALREALHTALLSAGYKALEAKDGIEGLLIAEAEKPNLILLDIQMPKMGGHEMLGALKKTSWGKDIQVILLTNADDATNIAHGVSLHSDDYIIKSNTSLEEILKRVKQHLAGYFD